MWKCETSLQVLHFIFVPKKNIYAWLELLGVISCPHGLVSFSLVLFNLLLTHVHVMHAYTNACTHAYIHIHACMNMCIHAFEHAYMHAYICTYMQLNIHTFVHTRSAIDLMHTCIHAHTRTLSYIWFSLTKLTLTSGLVELNQNPHTLSYILRSRDLFLFPKDLL